MIDFVSGVGELASLIGSLTVVGSALMWVYNRFISSPREKRRKREADERQLRVLELVTEKNEPLNQAIQNLNDLLKESQDDRKNLNAVAKNNTEQIKGHEDRLDNHERRIIVLEVKNGVRKTGYKETYGGEE